MAFTDFATSIVQRFSSSAGQVRKQPRWQTRSALPPMKQQRDTPYQIEVPSDLQRQVREFMDLIAPVVARAFGDHMNPTIETAFAGWPVKSGFSKSQFNLDYFVEDGGRVFRAQTTVRAFYAGLITQKGRKAKVAPKLLIKPFERAAQRVGQAVADGVVKGAQ